MAFHIRAHTSICEIDTAILQTEIRLPEGTPARGGSTLLYEMSSRLKPIVNWAISMKIASVRRRFLSEFVVKFILQRLFGFRCEMERLLKLRI